MTIDEGGSEGGGEEALAWASNFPLFIDTRRQ